MTLQLHTHTPTHVCQASIQASNNRRKRHVVRRNAHTHTGNATNRQHEPQPTQGKGRDSMHMCHVDPKCGTTAQLHTHTLTHVRQACIGATKNRIAGHVVQNDARLHTGSNPCFLHLQLPTRGQGHTGVIVCQPAHDFVTMATPDTHTRMHGLNEDVISTVQSRTEHHGHTTVHLHKGHLPALSTWAVAVCTQTHLDRGHSACTYSSCQILCTHTRTHQVSPHPTGNTHLKKRCI